MANNDFIRHGDWIDKLDRNIFNFVEYPGFDYRYPTIEGTPVSYAEVREMREASEKLYNIFAKTTKVFQRCSDSFIELMEIPPLMQKYLRASNVLNMPTWLSRFDFVKTDNGLKMVEINADTPCALVESYYANGVFCAEAGKDNPNANCYEGLKNFLLNIFNSVYHPRIDLASGRFTADHPFVFACFHDYIEDYGTTMFLKNAMEEAIGTLYPEGTVCFVSFYDLKVRDDGKILLPDGRTAGAIYRLHPMELLIEETADDGSSLGEAFMDGYVQGKFEMMNPPEAIIMQSKGFQALVWALSHSPSYSKVFTADEIETINRYMLPTYFEQDFYAAVNESSPNKLFIRKPIWGREGKGIAVVDCRGNICQEKHPLDPEEIVAHESKTNIYQDFVATESHKLLTDEGRIPGYYTWSCFMLGDRASAVYTRFSPEQVAGTEAYWSPLYLED